MGRVAADGDTVAVVAYTQEGSPTPWRVLLLDATDGSTRAEIALPATESVLDEVALTPTTAVALFRSGIQYGVVPRTYAVAPDTGSQLWSADGTYGLFARTDAGTVALGRTPDPLEPGTVLPLKQLLTVSAIDASTGGKLWTVTDAGSPEGVSQGLAIAVDQIEYEGAFTVVNRVRALDPSTGRTLWDRIPGDQPVSPKDSRRYRGIYTTGTFVGPRAVYVDGGCAITGVT